MTDSIGKIGQKVAKSWKSFAEDIAAMLESMRGPNTLVFADSAVLTPLELNRTFVPYIQALFDLERICSDLKQEQYVEPRIVSISQHSPVKLEFNGLVEALKVVDRIITPEGRRIARQMDELEIKKGEAEIALRQATVYDIRARISEAPPINSADAELKQAESAKLRAEAMQMEAEAEVKRAEAAKLRAEAAQMALSNEQARIDIALKILREFAPALNEQERMAYILRLVPVLKSLMEGPLQPLPPPTLPEQ